LIIIDVEDGRIFVQSRKGRKIAEDVKVCLDCIDAAGIKGPRMGGIHPDYGVIRDVPYEDRDRVLNLLNGWGEDPFRWPVLFRVLNR
jgi:hypothetical protein